MFEQYGVAVLGGLMIGGAAVLLLFTLGYPVGISGFLSKALAGPRKAGWRLSFLVGMLAVAFAMGSMRSGYLVSELGEARWEILLAAILVGAGARIAGGCTSGHSLCGMGRFDVDSILATAIFIASGAATVLALGV